MQGKSMNGPAVTLSIGRCLPRTYGAEMLNVDPIGEAGGGIHCATQQQPKNLL